MTFMTLSLITCLLMMGFTSRNLLLRLIGKTLGFGAVSGIVALISNVIGCSSKILPFSYCGELSGLYNIGASSLLVAITISVITLVIESRKLKLTKES